MKTALVTSLIGMATGTSALWCLDPRDGAKLASRYADLIGSFSADKARTLLTGDFVLNSNSMNCVKANPSANDTYASRDAFIKGQRCWPVLGVDVVAVDAVTCDTVVLRWTQRWSDASFSGISVLKAVMEGDDWRIRRVWEEFNGIEPVRNFRDLIVSWMCEAWQ